MIYNSIAFMLSLIAFFICLIILVSPIIMVISYINDRREQAERDAAFERSVNVLPSM